MRAKAVRYCLNQNIEVEALQEKQRADNFRTSATCLATYTLLKQVRNTGGKMNAENTSLAVGDKRINDNQETDAIGILEVYASKVKKNLTL